MTTAVFRNYDQAALDWEYDNQRKVANAAEFLEICASGSRDAQERGNPLRSIPYGSSAAETVDVFPAVGGNGGPAPVHIFFHGGYWRARSKDDFSCVAHAFAPAGAVTVVVDYALVPSVPFDELVRQCRAALAWTWKNAADFGGDRDRIYISGHSAGGHLTAMMMATDWPAFDTALPVDPIRGACGISGLYDLEPIRLCFLNQDLQLTPEVAARNSPVLLEPKCRAPLLLTVGGLEGPEYLRQTTELAAAWGRHGVNVTVRIMPEIHHFSIVAQLNDPKSELSRLIQAQMGLG
jgi:arylformamidase